MAQGAGSGASAGLSSLGPPQSPLLLSLSLLLCLSPIMSTSSSSTPGAEWVDTDEDCWPAVGGSSNQQQSVDDPEEPPSETLQPSPGPLGPALNRTWVPLYLPHRIIWLQDYEITVGVLPLRDRYPCLIAFGQYYLLPRSLVEAIAWFCGDSLQAWLRRKCLASNTM